MKKPTQVEIVKSIHKDAKKMVVMLEANQIILQGQVCPKEDSWENVFYQTSRKNLHDAMIKLGFVVGDLEKLLKLMKIREGTE